MLRDSLPARVLVVRIEGGISFGRCLGLPVGSEVREALTSQHEMEGAR